MYKIAILTYSFLRSYFQEIADSFYGRIDIDVIAFDKLRELHELIPVMSAQYDGLCVFSSSVNRFVRQARPEITKPLVYIDRRAVDFFKTFLVLLNNDRSVDLSRIFLDTTLIRPDAYRTVASIVEAISDFEVDRIQYTDELSLDEFNNFEEMIERNAVDLWEKGRMDMLVCRVASVATAIEKHGIPYALIFPERHRVAEAIENLINLVRIYKQKEGLPASIMVYTVGDNPMEYHEISSESIRVQKALLEFGKNYASSFSIRFITKGYEILTSHAIAQRITDDFTFCQLGHYLFSSVGAAFNIGYGIGQNISSARQNALIAEKTAVETGISCVVNEDGALIPLQTKPVADSNSAKGKPAAYLSEKTGLSPITLKRISSALHFLGKSEVTNHELATALQVTVANANRFLNTLVLSGYATILTTKKSAQKGRPSRIYRIALD